MSSAILIGFEGGVPTDSQEFQNSWGGSARIWDSAYERWIKNPMLEFDTWLAGNTKALWGLAERPDVPDFVRLVMASTFDNAIIYRKDFLEHAGHLREFAKQFRREGKVCHLEAWANTFEQWHNEGIEAIGLHATTVNEDPWEAWDEEADEAVPYNLNTGDKHFDVYEEYRTLSTPAP